MNVLKALNTNQSIKAKRKTGDDW